MKGLVLFSAVLATISAAKLPDYLAKCSKSDPKLSDCLLNSITQAWSTIVKGDNYYHIQALNPLKVSHFQVTVGDYLQGNVSDALFYGFENAQFEEIKWDLVKQRVVTKFQLPYFNVTGDYSLRGKLLGLPLEGNGVTNISFENMDNKHYFEYNTLNRDGKEYIEVKNTEMSYTTTRLRSYLGNLFNGEERLGKVMNEIVNENWVAVNKEINPYFGNAVGEIYSQVIQDFFKKVPLNHLFSE